MDDLFDISLYSSKTNYQNSAFVLGASKTITDETDRIEDEVDLGIACNFKHLFPLVVRPAVIHTLIRTLPSSSRQLILHTCSRNYYSSNYFYYLNSHQSQPSYSCVNQDCLAFFQVASTKKSTIAYQCCSSETSNVSERPSI